jgi:yecA family protein
MFKKLSQTEIEDLAQFLADPQRPNDTMCFQELQGFLFAVACSPVLIPTPAWMAIVSNDEEIGFKNETEAQKIMSFIVSLYNGINEAVLERSDSLPLGCEFREDVDKNFDEELAISQWSRGFMMGHDWLSDVWDEHLPDELDEEFGSTAMVLSFFSSKRLGELYHLEATTTPRHRRPRVTFTEYSEKVRELFPAALSSYAHIGRTISEILTGSRESDAQVV